MSGYVRIHRTLIDHPAFRTDAEAMAFAWLVAKASWKGARVRYKGHPVSLERGQLAISIRDFAEAMDRDKAWIERLLKRLKNEGMIETRAETGVTVVTICNYDKYQSEPVLCETPPETATRQTRDTEQVREEGKKKVRRAAPVQLPDWIDPETWTAFKRMRDRIKAPMTPDAETGIISDLATLRAQGHCPNKVLMKAVKHSWRGVFGKDDTKAETPQLTATELRQQAEFFDRRGDRQSAEQCRQKAIQLEQAA